MPDDMTPEQRHKNMQAIKSKDTKIELALRKVLWQNGIRYRKNYKKLIGKPDIAITKFKIAVFCDSEFWHGKNYHESVDRIDTNSEYWKKKIKRNMERDKEVTDALTGQGWTVLRFWEKEIKKDLGSCVLIITNAIKEKEDKHE